ncbi:MAG TPA: DMT family transporter, partial [Candidatus Limnocylindrales bacterium]|nr:DMT family transporter [Candidatus Limnocylindrales bacterium]
MTPAGQPAGVELSVPGTERTPAADRRLAEIGVLVVMILWAANFIVVKSALAVLPPVGFTFLRFAIASVTLLVLLRWREGSFGMPRRDFVGIVALGALGFGIYQILWTTGLTTVAAGDSALIIAATPVLVAFLAVLARSDVLTPAKLAGGLVSFAGVALVIASGPGLTLGRSLAGEAITLLAAVCWSIYLAFGAPYLNRHSPLRTTAWATVAGTIVLAPVALLQLASVNMDAL